MPTFAELIAETKIHMERRNPPGVAMVGPTLERLAKGAMNPFAPGDAVTLSQVQFLVSQLAPPKEDDILADITPKMPVPAPIRQLSDLAESLKNAWYVLAPHSVLPPQSAKGSRSTIVRPNFMQSGPREGLGRTITREKMQQELAAAAREAQAAPAPATRPKKTRGLKLPLLVRPKGEPTSWNDIPVQHTAPSGASSAKKAIENSGVISPPVSSAASIVPAHAAPFTAPIAATPNMGVRVAPKESILPGLLSEDAPAARRDSHDALTPVAPTHTLVAPAPIIPQPSPASVDAPPVARKKTERANAVTHVLKSYGERIREEGFTRGDLGSDNPKLYSALAVYFNHHPEARSMFPASFFNRKKRNPKAAEPAPDTQRAATDDVPTFPEPSVPFVTLTGGTADASTASAVAGTPPSLQDSPASALPSESSVEKPTRSAAGAVLADAPTFPEPSVHFVTLTGGTADTATVSAPVVEPALLQDSRASFVERLAEEREATQRPEPSQEALERYASSWEALRAFGLTKGYPDLVATLTDSKDRAPFADLSPQQAACALNDAFARAKEETLTLPGADFIGANPKGKAVTSLFARLLEAHAALHAAPAREL